MTPKLTPKFTASPGASPPLQGASPTLQNAVLQSRHRQYEKERDEAFGSLDEAKIRSLVTRWGLNIAAPVLRDDKAFWITVHKTRAALPSMTTQARTESLRFLEENGSEPFHVSVKRAAAALCFDSCVVPPADRSLLGLAVDRGQSLTVSVDIPITTRDATGQTRQTDITMPPGTTIRTVSETGFVLVGFCGDVPYPVTLTLGQWEPRRVGSRILSSEGMLRHALQLDEDADKLVSLARDANRYYGATLPATPCDGLPDDYSLLPHLGETVRAIHARLPLVFPLETSLYAAGIAAVRHARETRRVALKRTQNRKWRAA